MSTGGRRELEEEKTLVAEVGRMVHVVKANEKQRKVIVRAKSKAQKSEKQQPTPCPGAKPTAVTKALKKASKKAPNGGSIWITFTPSFHQRATNSEKDAADMQWRLEQSKRRRERSFAAAQAYIASAVGQAEEAGLAAGGRPVSEEGAAYLFEQYAAAKAMLNVVPVGSPSAQRIVATAPEGASVAAHLCEEATDKAFKEAWNWAIEQITRERMFLVCPTFASPEVADDDEAGTTTGSSRAAVVADEAMLSIEEEARALVHDYRFLVKEPVEDGSGDIVPSKCIVKLKGPGRKVTTILSTQKAVSAFKTNLVQQLKKDMMPLLAKSSDVAPQTAAAPKGKGNAASAIASSPSSKQQGGTAKGHGKRSGRK